MGGEGNLILKNFKGVYVLYKLENQKCVKKKLKNNFNFIREKVIIVDKYFVYLFLDFCLYILICIFFFTKKELFC